VPIPNCLNRGVHPPILCPVCIKTDVCVPDTKSRLVLLRPNVAVVLQHLAADMSSQGADRLFTDAGTLSQSGDERMPQIVPAVADSCIRAGHRAMLCAKSPLGVLSPRRKTRLRENYRRCPPDGMEKRNFLARSQGSERATSRQAHTLYALMASLAADPGSIQLAPAITISRTASIRALTAALAVT
jgi:hypothetical protein